MSKLSEAYELILEKTPIFQRESRRKELEAKYTKTKSKKTTTTKE